MGSGLIGCTILRIRGRIQWNLATAGITNAVVGIRVGDQAELAGASIAQQNPAAVGQNDDWMAYEPFMPATSALTDSFDTQHGRIVDIKAKRKIDELGEALLLFAGGNSAVAATAPLSFTLSILVALH